MVGLHFRVGRTGLLVTVAMAVVFIEQVPLRPYPFNVDQLRAPVAGHRQHAGRRQGKREHQDFVGPTLDFKEIADAAQQQRDAGQPQGIARVLFVGREYGRRPGSQAHRLGVKNGARRQRPGKAAGHDH
ncbi:hypothetical protein SD425_26745 (plasmid) [Hymenobacter sp. GOD-10R]|nr:hypothetical protein [Hymenobacter sp. GOD-10R]WRQ31477.1 hypothetical protein SD425_26745 [Hymenobacter sp. GOD-10R]